MESKEEEEGRKIVEECKQQWGEEVGEKEKEWDQVRVRVGSRMNLLVGMP